MENIRSKVRKFLAMAAADSGASDNERAFAMKKAQELIEEHNIELGSLGADAIDHVQVKTDGAFVRDMKKPYHRVIGSAVASLYDCRHMLWANVGGHAFWGAQHQVEAAEETFLWVIAQVEEQYRIALKAFDGRLSKAQRAELRASFKDACAARVAHRISDILRDRNTNRDSRALVVVNTVQEKLDGIMKEKEIKKSRDITLRQGFGAIAGYRAGDHVRIQKEVQR